MELQRRKQYRLTQYDYSTPNAYFITICTKERKNLFWANVGAIIDRPYDLNGSSLAERSSIQTSRVSVWQKSFYDHVIRNDGDYRDIWNYIEGNPGK